MGVMPISVEEQAQLIDLYLYHEAHNEENFPLAFWNSFLGSLPAAGVSRSKKVISITFVINYLNAKIDVLQANPKLSGLNFYSTGPNTRAYEFKFQIENIFKKLFLPKLQSIVLKSWKEAITEELDSNLDLDNLRLIVKGKTQPNHHSLQNEVIIQLRKNLLSHGIYSSLEFNLDLLFDYNFLSNVTSAQ